MEDLALMKNHQTAAFTEYVKMVCTDHYYDPETDMICCNRWGGQACFALSNLCVLENGKSICIPLNVLMDKVPFILPVAESLARRVCAQCGQAFIPNSNRQHYCHICGETKKREAARERKARQRQNTSSVHRS